VVQTCISPNNDICTCLLDMKHRLTKNVFWEVNNKKWRYGLSLFHLSYLKTLMSYLCSQRTPIAQINNFMLDCSIYTLFVLNRGRKQDPLQIMIFVYISSTWSLGQHNTRFETWITRNDVSGVRLFNLSYLITLIVSR
jgi:hypothetical protein